MACNYIDILAAGINWKAIGRMFKNGIINNHGQPVKLLIDEGSCSVHVIR